MADFNKKMRGRLGSEKTSGCIMTVLFIAMLMVINTVLYTLTEAFNWRISYSDQFDYSLSGSTDELFKEAQESGKKVKISFCMGEDEIKSHKTGAEVYITAKNFDERYGDFIELDYINIIKMQNQNGEFVSLDKYRTDMKDKPNKILKTSVIFECGDNYRVLTDSTTSAGFATFFNLDSQLYVNSYNGEEVMAAMISWVLADEHKTAYFTQYHGETAEVAFSNLLVCAGYDIDVIDLRKNSVPEDCDLLVISNPTSDFEAAREGSDVIAERDRLEAYIERGGNLLVSLDPYVKSLPVLEGVLKNHGISFSTTKLDNGKTVRNMIKEDSNAITADGFTFIADYADTALGQKLYNTVSKYSDGGVILREASALEVSGAAKPVLVSSSSSRLEAGGTVTSRTGGYTVAAASEYVTKDGQTTRIFVIPSIYLAVSDALTTNGYSNKDFIYSIFGDFYGAEGMPYGCNSVVYSSSTLENLTMGTARLYTIAVLMIPLAIAAVGTVVIVRRKNR